MGIVGMGSLKKFAHATIQILQSLTREFSFALDKFKLIWIDSNGIPLMFFLKKKTTF